MRDVSEDTVKQLIESGPLAEFYKTNPIERPQKDYPLDCEYLAVCEVIRHEERVKPLVPKEQNPGRDTKSLLFPAYV